ncbi:MAG: NADH-quinone oxidoreductase subunit C [Bacteroidota bacterium]
MEITALINFLKAQIDGLSIEQTENCTPKGITISSQHLKAVCELLHENEQFYFDMLSCITGIDNGVESGAMEVIYNLYSIPFERSLTIKVALDRKKPEVASVFDIWRTADWHEREVFDLFGIHFSGHPDLRRILLPADWNGHPLRKDYKHQDYYHGIKVEY